MWRAWRVSRANVGGATDRPAADLRLSEAVAPAWVAQITLPAAAIARLVMAPIAQLEHFTDANAPELVYVPPLVMRKLLGAVGQQVVAAAAFAVRSQAHLSIAGVRFAAAAFGALGGLQAMRAHFLAYHETHGGLLSLGDLVSLLQLVYRDPTARDTLMARVGQFRGLFKYDADASAAIAALYALVRRAGGEDAPTATAAAFSDTAIPGISGGGGGGSDGTVVRVAQGGAVSWLACLRALADDALVQFTAAPASAAAAASEAPAAVAVSFASAVDAMNAVRAEGTTRVIAWAPGAVVLPERVRAVCGALAWGGVRDAATALDPEETVAFRAVGSAADCEVPLLLAWLAANRAVAERVRNLHALSLARFGIMAPLCGAVSGAEAVRNTGAYGGVVQRGGWGRCSAWHTDGAGAEYRALAADVDETRQFLAAVATMHMVDLALGGGTAAPGQMDACSALFVWLVQDLVRIATGHAETAVLPIRAADFAAETTATTTTAPAPAPAAAGGVAAAAAAQSEDDEKGGERRQQPSVAAALARAMLQAQARDGAATLDEATVRAATDAAAVATQTSPQQTEQMLAAALPRLIVWHRAFLRATRVRRVEHERERNAVDALLVPRETGALRLPEWMTRDVPADVRTAIAAASGAADEAGAVVRFYLTATWFALRHSEFAADLGAATTMSRVVVAIGNAVRVERDTASIVLTPGQYDGTRFMDAFPVPLSIHTTTTTTTVAAAAAT